MFRFTIHDLLWLMVVVGMSVGWWHHAWDLSIGKAMAEQEMRLLSAEIKRLRTELADVRPEKVYP